MCSNEAIAVALRKLDIYLFKQRLFPYSQGNIACTNHTFLPFSKSVVFLMSCFPAKKRVRKRDSFQPFTISDCTGKTPILQGFFVFLTAFVCKSFPLPLKTVFPCPVNVHSGQFFLSISLNHTVKFPAITFIKGSMVRQQI